LTRQGKPASQHLEFVPLAFPARPQTRDQDLRSVLLYCTSVKPPKSMLDARESLGR